MGKRYQNGVHAAEHGYCVSLKGTLLWTYAHRSVFTSITTANPFASVLPDNIKMLPVPSATSKGWYIFLTKALCHDGKTRVLKNGTCQFHLRSDIEQPPEAVALTLTSKFNHHSGWPR